MRLAPTVAAGPGIAQPVLIRHVKEVNLGTGHLFIELSDRSEVVHDPEAPAHRGKDQVSSMELDVRDWSGGQVLLKRLPVGPIVEGDIHPEFGAGVQEAGPLWVFPNHPHGMVGGNAIVTRGDPGPRVSVVGRLVDVGLPVVKLEAIDGHICFSGLMRRNVDGVHPSPLGKALRGDIRPLVASISGDVNQAVEGARPEDFPIVGRLLDDVGRAEVLLAGDVPRNGLARPTMTDLRIRRQIRTDPFPAFSFVGTPMNVLGPIVEDIRIIRGDLDGDRPLEPMLEVRRVMAVDELSPNLVILLLAVDAAVPSKCALAVRIDHIRVVGMGNYRTRLATAYRLPLRLGTGRRAASGGETRQRDRRVVLLTRVYPVRKLVVHVHLVELGGGLILLGGPRLSPIQRDIRPAIIGLDQEVRVVGVDPHVVIVAVRRRNPVEVGPGICGLVEALLGVHIDHVALLRIPGHIGVIEGTLHQIVPVIHQLPGLPLVIRPVEPLLRRLGLHQRPDAIGVGRRDAEVDLSDQALRHMFTGKNSSPVFSPIGALPDAVAAGMSAATDDGPGLPLSPPRSGIENVRVLRMHFDVNDADAVGRKELFRPRFASIRGLENPSLFVFAKGMAQGGDVGDVRVLRMNLDGPDLTTLLEAHQLPALSPVCRLEDPTPGNDVAPDAVRAGAGVDDTGIGRRHLNGPHRAGGEGRSVRDVLPRVAVVGRLPDPPTDAPHVEGEGMVGVTGNRRHAPSPRGADHPVFHCLIEGGIVGAIFLTARCRPRILGPCRRDYTREKEGKQREKKAGLKHVPASEKKNKQLESQPSSLQQKWGTSHPGAPFCF